MSGRTLLLALALPLLASAQLQLNVVENGVERVASGIYEAGSVQVGENLDTKFRIRNTGQASITLQTLIVSGTGFRATGYPALPYIVAPGTNVDFTVRFSPANYGSYSASMNVNTTSILLRATALAGAILSFKGTSLASGSTVDFGLVERGSSSSQRFVLKNTTAVAVVVTSAKVTGAGFSGPVGLSLPMQIAPNAEAAFDVAFEPKESGIAKGVLTVDDRNYQLTASASEPPFPRPAVMIESAALTSGKQGKVSVKLASASRAIGEGKLRIDFQPVGGVTDNDNGIQFVANSSRTISFRVTEGATDALFGDGAQAVFQTGTTAGTLTFVAEVGGYKEQITATVSPGAVQIDSAQANRSGSMLEVTVAGYDNTRTASNMSFTFFNTAGQAIGAGAISVDAAADFRKFFDTSKLGGTFFVKAAFPVAGNINDVAGVEVQMKNSSGTTSTQRLKF